MKKTHVIFNKQHPKLGTIEALSRNIRRGLEKGEGGKNEKAQIALWDGISRQEHVTVIHLPHHLHTITHWFTEPCGSTADILQKNK